MEQHYWIPNTITNYSNQTHSKEKLSPTITNCRIVCIGAYVPWFKFNS
uniref:Uncharacterized protein n=1 Tax=Arundo donax TaxID=35708 RepID=A0A0A9AD00_ARUDO